MNSHTWNTDLVDEHHTRNYFRHSLINVTLDYFVYFPSQLVRYFGSSRSDEAAHYAHDILPSLRPCICRVEVAQRNILNELLSFMHVALGERNVCFRLQVVRRGICI